MILSSSEILSFEWVEALSQYQQTLVNASQLRARKEGREKGVEIEKGYKRRDRGAYWKNVTVGMISKGHEGIAGAKGLGKWKGYQLWSCDCGNKWQVYLVAICKPPFSGTPTICKPPTHSLKLNKAGTAFSHKAGTSSAQNCQQNFA